MEVTQGFPPNLAWIRTALFNHRFFRDPHRFFARSAGACATRPPPIASCFESRAVKGICASIRLPSRACKLDNILANDIRDDLPVTLSLLRLHQLAVMHKHEVRVGVSKLQRQRSSV